MGCSSQVLVRTDIDIQCVGLRAAAALLGGYRWVRESFAARTLLEDRSRVLLVLGPAQVKACQATCNLLVIGRELWASVDDLHNHLDPVISY